MKENRKVKEEARNPGWTTTRSIFEMISELSEITK
jgi:hypothetical protein